MAGFGKELVWNWKGVRIVLEERWNGVGREMELQWKEVGSLVGQWMGLTGDEKALACRIIRGRAVVVGVRENADFPLAQYLPNSWMGCCCGCNLKENAEFPPKMSKKCVQNAKVYILIPT
eukprot:scaffold11292_cov67-Cyclotella_meneghiniana.AAC.7